MLISRNTSAIPSPASFPREDSIGQLATFDSIHKGGASVKGNVIESPVPHSGVCHSVGGKCHHCTDDGAGHDIIPVVELVNGERTSD